MVAKEFQIVIFLLNFDGINGKIKEIFFFLIFYGIMNKTMKS